MDVARIIALRSLCDRDRVGAVVVDGDNRIVDTGYNGPPRHFSPAKTHERCTAWCRRAKTQTVTSLVIDGVDRLTGRMHPTYDDCPSLHAEQNALMFSDRRLREGGTIYVSSGVCMTCAKLIANSGLRRVVSRLFPQHEHRRTDDGFAFMESCGLEVVCWHVPAERDPATTRPVELHGIPDPRAGRPVAPDSRYYPHLWQPRDGFPVVCMCAIGHDHDTEERSA